MAFHSSLGLLSAACAIAYLFCPRDRIVTAFVKAGAVAGLAVLALNNGFWLLAAALALCAMGDFALARPGDKWFLAGMAAFAVGHAVYACLFFVGVSGLLYGLTPLAVGALIVIAVVLGWRFASHAGPLAGPVMGYVAVITAMGLSALTLAFGLLTVGVVLFMLSDTLIGQQKFLHVTWRGQDVAIWASYYLAQVLILIGWAPFGTLRIPAIG